MNKSKRKVIVGGLGVLGASITGLPLRAQKKPEFTMVFAHTFSQASEKYVVTGIDLFKNLAEKYTDNRLLVDVHEGGKLGGQNVLPQKVQQGAVQACQLSMQNFTPFAESFNLLDFPYLFSSNDRFERFLESDVIQNSLLASESASKGFTILPGLWANAGFRVFGVSKKINREVRLPADLKGLKIRVTSSRVEQQAIALTTGSPVSINWAETYQAMQQGACDALNVGLGPLTATKIHETLGTVTRVNMNFNAHITVMSKKWFDGLPGEVKAGITKAANEAWLHQKTTQKRADEQMWKEWASAGIKIIDLTSEQRNAWLSAIGPSRPEWRQLKEKYGSSLFDQIAKFG